MRGSLLSIVLVVLFGFTQVIKSQQRVPAVFGIQAGLNVAGLTIDDRGTRSIKPGFHAGAFYSFPLAGRLALQPEIMYSARGASILYESEFLGIDPLKPRPAETTVFDLNYIDILVPISFSVNNQLSISIGPYTGFLLNAGADNLVQPMEAVGIDPHYKISERDFRDRDYGISAGLGMDFGSYVFGLRYNIGLTRVTLQNAATDMLLGNASNMLLQLYFAIKL